MESRACSQCCCDFPLTDEYFHRDVSKPDGFKTVCKMCRLDEKKRKENDAIDDRIQKLEERGIKLLDTLVTGGSNIPHMAETYQRIMEVFGGPMGFAQHFLANYLSTKPGSAARGKQISTIIILGVKVSESGAAEKSLDGITDEELESEINATARALLLFNDGSKVVEMEDSKVNAGDTMAS